MSKTEKPSIRFHGFDDAWEQRKFSDITFPAGEKNKDNLPLESYSITNEHGFVPQDEKFENGGTMREADKRMYYIVSPNSFAYNPARINVGSIGYQNVGKNVIVSSLYEVFKTSEDVDDRLLWHWFKSPDFQKLIMQLQEGGVRLYFKLKNWIWISLVLVLSIGVSIILFKSAFFDISKFEELAPDFHYNAISMSAIIGGFLFTGISILISVIDKERIERLWNNSYLDNLYRSAFVGMIANIITIIVAFSLVFLDIPSKAEDIFVEIEIAALIIGVVFFAWCIKYLLFIISKLKTEK